MGSLETVQASYYRDNAKHQRYLGNIQTADYYDDLARKLEPNQEEDVHTRHCCKNHGCKYGDDVALELDNQSFVGCSVVSGRKKQNLPCGKTSVCWDIGEAFPPNTQEPEPPEPVDYTAKSPTPLSKVVQDSYTCPKCQNRWSGSCKQCPNCQTPQLRDSLPEDRYTLALIESISAICHILNSRDLNTTHIQEALTELGNDADVVEMTNKVLLKGYGI